MLCGYTSKEIENFMIIVYPNLYLIMSFWDISSSLFCEIVLAQKININAVEFFIKMSKMS